MDRILEAQICLAISAHIVGLVITNVLVRVIINISHQLCLPEATTNHRSVLLPHHEWNHSSSTTAHQEAPPLMARMVMPGRGSGQDFRRQSCETRFDIIHC